MRLLPCSTLFFVVLIQFSNISKVSSQSFDPYTQSVPDESINLKFVPVQGGYFDMGSLEKDQLAQADEKPSHKVKVDDFWMGVYEVTWEQFDTFVFQELDALKSFDKDKLKSLGIDGVTSASTPYVDMSFGMGKDDYPAVNMTQYGATMFCKWLSAKTGVFYRLPTEAEWEYACKKGALSNGVPLDEQAWSKKNSDFQYEEIGTKRPNNLGIYDMLGNVAEWVLDQYDTTFYSNSPIDNPLNTPKTLYPRVVRGGSWKDMPEQLRCAARQPSKSRWKRRDPQIPKSQWWLTNAPFVGFRIVRPKVAPTITEIENYWLEPMDDF
ncbi:MAG: formylglycine-generating enzyme family protein [Cyclobacteriaceae bacterium]|nr:formylglycine-generating enzyme family protein [Cyclobacteriaceae bacterium]